MLYTEAKHQFLFIDHCAAVKVILNSKYMENLKCKKEVLSNCEFSSLQFIFHCMKLLFAQRASLSVHFWTSQLHSCRAVELWSWEVHSSTAVP